ncbi:MAG: tRNA (adenosine(37)-N6)-threonylcarbamoyltransferase complex dimerization subunit type 1 TsaB [Acutalibacteraceae bacterium]|nr:tRNA (adenosine(37)-N6)-threonylcarbamoyltransferase complex dimerization subunit type 1 TsaB [Acutalibacteraceae bacterium]
MNILAMDSSSTAASVAYLSDDKILAQSYINAGLTHSTTLMPMAQAMLENANLSLSEVDYFAVSIGPGSFTGLRIGISAIKGLSLAENKPCVPVSTLEAMAYNYAYTDIIVCAVIDARCKRFFNAMLKCGDDGTVERLCEDRVLSFEELETELNEKYADSRVVLVGDGAEPAIKLMTNVKCDLKVAPPHLRYQQASGVAMAAIKLAQGGEVVSSHQLLPSYLSLPQAQRELQKKLKKDE